MNAVKAHPATLFRQLLARPGLIRGINIYDPLTARLAQQSGFDAIALGGYQQGSALWKRGICGANGHEAFAQGSITGEKQ